MKCNNSECCNYDEKTEIDIGVLYIDKKKIVEKFCGECNTILKYEEYDLNGNRIKVLGD